MYVILVVQLREGNHDDCCLYVFSILKTFLNLHLKQYFNIKSQVKYVRIPVDNTLVIYTLCKRCMHICTKCHTHTLVRVTFAKSGCDEKKSLRIASVSIIVSPEVTGGS